MRSLIFVASLSVTALVLQGCGGGGGGGGDSGTTTLPPPTKDCVNQKFNLVTQSATGTIYGTESGMTPKPQSVPIAFTLKIDMEQFNMYSEGTLTFEGLPMVQKQITNASAKEAVEYTKLGESASCKKKVLKMPDGSDLPGIEDLQRLWKDKYLPQMQDKATCTGNDGTNDVYSVTYAASVNVPGSPDPASVNVKGELRMNNYMMDSASGTMSGEGTNPITKQKMTIQADADVFFQGTTGTGPTKEDLDYSSWGDCKPVEVSSVEELLTPTKPVLQGASTVGPKGIFSSFLVDAVKANRKHQEKVVV